MGGAGAAILGGASVDERCEHNMVPDQCTYCLASKRAVYISGGGQSYHDDRKCSALRRGQGKIERSGGEVAHVETVSVSEAERRGYEPCGHCTGLVSTQEIPAAPHVVLAAQVWICAEERSRKSLRANGRYHERKNCVALTARVRELAGTVQRIDRGAAKRLLKQCPSCGHETNT
jgi:hypothetical protein